MTYYSSFSGRLNLIVMGKLNVPGGSTALIFPENWVPSGSNIGLLFNSFSTAKAISVSAEGDTLAKLTARQVIETVDTSLEFAGFAGVRWEPEIPIYFVLL